MENLEEKKEIRLKKEHSSEKKIGDYIKHFLFKDRFVFVLSLMFLLTFLISIFRILNVSLGNNILTTTINLFPLSLWLFLLIMLAISTILAYYKKYTLLFLPIMIWLLVTTVAIRTSNIPGLKNAATGEWVLGPDLDPFLFLRNAVDINKGVGDYEIDMMRYAPIGAPSTSKSSLMPSAIVFIHKITSLFLVRLRISSTVISPAGLGVSASIASKPTSASFGKSPFTVPSR